MNFSINMEQVLIGNRQEMIQRYWEKLKHLVLGLCHQLNIMNYNNGLVAEPVLYIENRFHG